jgi:hypothetical protein
LRLGLGEGPFPRHLDLTTAHREHPGVEVEVAPDPNRRGREWHTQAVCDERSARLDRGLDDSPEPFDVMRCRF